MEMISFKEYLTEGKIIKTTSSFDEDYIIYENPNLKTIQNVIMRSKEGVIRFYVLDLYRGRKWWAWDAYYAEHEEVSQFVMNISRPQDNERLELVLSAGIYTLYFTTSTIPDQHWQGYDGSKFKQIITKLPNFRFETDQ